MSEHNVLFINILLERIMMVGSKKMHNVYGPYGTFSMKTGLKLILKEHVYFFTFWLSKRIVPWKSHKIADIHMKIILELSIEKLTHYIAVWPGKANSCSFILCEYYHTIYFLELCMHPFYGDKNDAYFSKRTLQFTPSKYLFRCRSKVGTGQW